MVLPSEKSHQGYTFLECLTIIAIVGILSAIAAPTWLGFVTRLRLNAAQAQALSAMREAQTAAKREKRVWEACFRQNETEKKVEFSAHPVPAAGGGMCANARWQNLIESDGDGIAIATNGTARSTLFNRNNIYRVQFGYKGRVNGQLGKITFIAANQTNQNRASKRCVVVSTLLGAIRTAGNNECNGD
jgi:type II secretory pathway pseudopilin PulG